MNDPERDKFYTDSLPAEDDDDDYELEDPDPSVDEFRKRAILESMDRRIDIDAVYREAERDRGSEILEDWFRKLRSFQWRFRVKHLLALTAVVSLALALGQLGVLWPVLVVGMMVSVASLYLYLSWQDNKHQAEAERQREKLYEERRKQLGPRSPGSAFERPVENRKPADNLQEKSPVPEDLWNTTLQQERIPFQFSLRDALLVMTAIAVILGMMHWLGGPAATASFLGLAALGGLLVLGLGYDPPWLITFSWWFLLVLYVGISLVAVILRNAS